MKPIWVAILEDGGVLIEGPGRTWDDVPADAKIRSLQIRDMDGGATLVSLDGFLRYYASNECTAVIGRRGVPSAKVIAGVRADGKVEEARLAFAWSSAELSGPSVPERAIRAGVPSR